MKDVKQSKAKRSMEITSEYFAFLELNQIAQILHISHVHLSDTIQKTTRHHPSNFSKFFKSWTGSIQGNSRKENQK